MPAYTHWFVPHRILVIHYAGRVGAADVRAAILQLVDMLRDAQPPTYLISDMLDVTEFAPDLVKVRELGTGRKEPRLTWALTVSTNPLASMLSTLTAHIAGVPAHQSRTREDVLTFISERDATLPQLDALALARLLAGDG